MIVYEGAIPTKSIYISEMQQDWSNVPEFIKEFYDRNKHLTTSK